MKRVRKNLLAGSLVATLFFAAFYVRGGRGDSFYFRTPAHRYFFLDFDPGRLELNHTGANTPSVGRRMIGHRSFGTDRTVPMARSILNYLGFYSGGDCVFLLPDGQKIHFRQTIIPLWMICAVTGIPIWIWIWKTYNLKQYFVRRKRPKFEIVLYTGPR